MKNKYIVSVALLLASLQFSCTKEGLEGSTDTGKGGSLSRFTISGNYMYTVDPYAIYTYDLTNPAAPKKVNTTSIAFDVETIYPYKNNLFIGSRNGMYIYSIAEPAAPVKVGEALHVRSCDPVVANDSVSFVTLKGGSACGPAVSGLYVHNIKDLSKPVLIKMVQLPDPAGLGLQDNFLYICCGNDGLKVFDVANPYDPKLLDTKQDGNYIDVIPYNGTLICYTSTGMLLYDITTPSMPRLLKEIAN